LSFLRLNRVGDPKIARISVSGYDIYFKCPWKRPIELILVAITVAHVREDVTMKRRRRWCTRTPSTEKNYSSVVKSYVE
jgi:hypothetical protein